MHSFVQEHDLRAAIGPFLSFLSFLSFFSFLSHAELRSTYRAAQEELRQLERAHDALTHELEMVTAEWRGRAATHTQRVAQVT